MHKLEDPERLGGWLARIAVFTARGCLRSRQRRRWLRFGAPESLPELEAPQASAEDRRAVQATYAVLSRLSPRSQIAFTLRFIEAMTVAEGAEACAVSPATFKRRVAKAREEFLAAARDEPELGAWLGGERWRAK